MATTMATETAPTKFPAKTSVQFRASCARVTRRLATARTIRVFPVNSSAPRDDHEDQAERERDPGQQTRRAGSERGPVATVVENTAPSAM